MLSPSSSSDLSFFSKSKAQNPPKTSMPREIYVTTRLAWKAQQLADQPPHERPRSQGSTTPPSPPAPRPKLTPIARVKSAPAEKRSRPPSPDAKDRPRPKKRATPGSASSSRPASRPRDAEPIFRASRSRSTSAFPSADAPRRRRCWIRENGSPGEDFVSAADVVKGLVRTYKSYFRNLDDPTDTSFEVNENDYPMAELEYPNNNACESFILLAPKDPDHYNPIMCLEQSLYTIIECYLTPAQQALFGRLPTDLLTDDTPPSSPLSPPPSLPPDSPSEASESPISPSSFHEPTGVDYLRLIQRAIRRHDGPLFVQTMVTVNQLLRSLKYPPLPPDPFSPSPPNMLTECIKDWTATGIPNKVLMRLIDETYQRSVGPHVGRLNRYEAFSSEVYGELMPSFTADIIAVTGLNETSLFVDLGSGVGNVIMQASLETGCRSYGIELMPTPAEVGREQLRQFKKRCRMWGVSSGEVELEEGDMLTSRRVSELLPQADVVLVNNKVFLQSLNEALRPKFLDLKEGAIVVSLKPFVSSLNARVTERNVDDISAIFDVVERPYRSGSVSWGSNGGSYYLHRVDREGYASIKQRFESSRARLGRSSSRR
ncbi:DOT1-domain-containing protein [Leucogyrophana mollusca]|uniref:DOT1-domain-containing protein n=1 Tax=Leucogyrophana mollusca TaxID=85980 RepID=A0ACB8BMX2_9AGAM|nr:DOT1-domain-containing protein [Leucogyrophana mollusca]